MNEWMVETERERGKDETFLRKQTEFEREFGCYLKTPLKKQEIFDTLKGNRVGKWWKRKSFVEYPTLVQLKDVFTLIFITYIISFFSPQLTLESKLQYVFDFEMECIGYGNGLL